jgi:hypothetical protein
MPGRVSLQPGETFKLPIVFFPKEEHSKTGLITISTATEKWEIELVGVGREAVLIITNTSVDFTDCIIGNCYEQRLVIKNVGDVNYPVSFQLDKEEPDVEFVPKSLVMQPFSEIHVIVAFTPTRDLKKSTILTVSSPYSTSKLPMSFHSGHATLEFEKDILDFGLFERRTNPTLKLRFKNAGMIKTSFMIKDKLKPSRFIIEPFKGLIMSQETREITLRHIRHDVATFKETICVTTDLVDYLKNIEIRGQSEEAILHPDEFSSVNMGICPVMDISTYKLKFKNYGRYPIDYEFKSSYPLRVNPTTGRIKGFETGEVCILWNPSGAYELKSQVNMVTNIGVYNISVRGKSTFPELHIAKNHMDFGVCAIGHTYTQLVRISNQGKVPLAFNIPIPPLSVYSVTERSGTLVPKAIKDIQINFIPAALEKYNTNILVECKRISVKEITLVGAGGTLKWDVQPSTVYLGIISCFYFLL